MIWTTTASFFLGALRDVVDANKRQQLSQLHQEKCKSTAGLIERSRAKPCNDGCPRPTGNLSTYDVENAHPSFERSSVFERVQCRVPAHTFAICRMWGSISGFTMGEDWTRVTRHRTPCVVPHLYPRLAQGCSPSRNTQRSRGLLDVTVITILPHTPDGQSDTKLILYRSGRNDYRFHGCGFFDFSKNRDLLL